MGFGWGDDETCGQVRDAGGKRPSVGAGGRHSAGRAGADRGSPGGPHAPSEHAHTRAHVQAHSPNPAACPSLPRPPALAAHSRRVRAELAPPALVPAGRAGGGEAHSVVQGLCIETWKARADPGRQAK